MYRQRQQSNIRSTNNTWRRHGPPQVQKDTETSSNNKMDSAFLFERSIYDGLVLHPIGAIPKPDDEPGDKDLEITNYRSIGSYSWTEAANDKPTILIPGSPPQWKNTILPFQVVEPDSGPRIIDQNGFRTWSGGIGYLLPLVAAVTHNQGLKETPFDWSSVDVVVDRGALRKLIRWANRKLTYNQKVRTSDKLFRLDLQLAGKTLLINRVSLKYAEEHLYQTYRGGFGRVAMTPAPGCANALDYYRIGSYEINGLKMVVRFEVDAYDSGASCNDPVDELAAALQATSIQSPETLRMQGLTIQKAGEEVPQTSLLELGTRWVGNKFKMDWSEIYCQLFLSQTPKHMLAYHSNGLFGKMEERRLDSDPELEAAKTDAQSRMKQLVKVINRIRDLVIKAGKDSRLSLVCVYGDLRVYKRRSQDSCLPDDILEFFE